MVRGFSCHRREGADMVPDVVPKGPQTAAISAAAADPDQTGWRIKATRSGATTGMDPPETVSRSDGRGCSPVMPGWVGKERIDLVVIPPQPARLRRAGVQSRPARPI